MEGVAEAESEAPEPMAIEVETKDCTMLGDAEIEEMAQISASELAFVRGVLSLPDEAVDSLAATVGSFRVAAAACHTARAAAESVIALARRSSVRALDLGARCERRARHSRA